MKNHVMKITHIDEGLCEWDCDSCNRIVMLDLETKKFVVMRQGDKNFSHIISPDDYQPLYEFPWERP